MNRKNGQQRIIEDIEREVAYTRQLIGRNHLDPRVMDAMLRYQGTPLSRII